MSILRVIPHDMSELVTFPTLRGVPKAARWWRLYVKPEPSGIKHGSSFTIYTDESGVSVTWWDNGHVTDETAFAVSVNPAGPTDPVITRTMPVLDALHFARPTANPDWQPLTHPGDHVDTSTDKV